MKRLKQLWNAVVHQPVWEQGDSLEKAVRRYVEGSR